MYLPGDLLGEGLSSSLKFCLRFLHCRHIFPQIGSLIERNDQHAFLSTPYCSFILYSCISGSSSIFPGYRLRCSRGLWLKDCSYPRCYTERIDRGKAVTDSRGSKSERLSYHSEGRCRAAVARGVHAPADRGCLCIYLLPTTRARTLADRALARTYAPGVLDRDFHITHVAATARAVA